jgi:hypothetical protein
MDELIGLPVKGEAFLLRRGGRHILVDGGWNGRDLSRAIKTHDPGIAVIDIVICTHGDADHARGLASFLDHWSLPLPANELRQSRHIGQFWLPGKWADVLPRLMTDPRGIIADLIRELDELRIDVAQDNEADDDKQFEILSRTLEDRVGSDRRRDRYHAQRALELPEGVEPPEGTFVSPEPLLGWTEPQDEPPWFDSLRRNVGEAVRTAREANRAFASGKDRVRYRVRRGRINESLAKFWARID